MSNVIFCIFHQTTISPKNQNILDCLCSSHLRGAKILQPGIASQPAGVWRLSETCQSQAAVTFSSEQNPLRVLFWRRFWDVNSGRCLSQISAINFEKDMKTTRTSPSPCYLSSSIQCSVTFLTDKLPLFPPSILLRSPQYLSSIPSGSWLPQQKQPFLYSWAESDQQGNVLERRPDSVLMALRYPSL